MYRILALLVVVMVTLIGCAQEPTPTPPPTTEPTTAAPTEAATSTSEPTATSVPPTVAPTNTAAPTATPQPITGTVKSTLNVRDQPTTRGKLLGVLKKDDAVTLVGRTEDKTWLQINYPLGETTTAWVIADRIATTIDITTLTSISSTTGTPPGTQVAGAVTSTIPAETGTPSATRSATETTTAPTVSATVTTTRAAATVQPTAVATTTTTATGGNPSGSIVFDTFENGGFNIYRVRADGTGLQQLIAGASEPSLSPDGSRLAYRMRRDTGGLGIGVASATGQPQFTVTQESAAGYPTWSPDGNNIGYHILPSGRLSGQILRIGVGPNNTPTVIGIGVRPAWQGGTGTTILFDGCKGAGDCGSLLSLNPFEGDPNNPNLIEFGIAGAWSPNGSQIAFQAPDDKGNTQIWVSNADGSNRRQITTETGTNGMPIWSSDGQWLFYRSDQGGTGWAIYAIRTNGSSARKIIDSNVNADYWVYEKLAIAP